MFSHKFMQIYRYLSTQLMYQHKHICTCIHAYNTCAYNMHAHINTHLHIHTSHRLTHIYIHICMHLPYVYTNSLTGIHTAIHICMYTHIHTHIHANKYTCSSSMKKEHEDLVLRLYSLKSSKKFSPSDGKISEK